MSSIQIINNDFKRCFNNTLTLDQALKTSDIDKEINENTSTIFNISKRRSLHCLWVSWERISHKNSVDCNFR